VKLSESLDFRESLTAATSALKGNSKHSNFSRRTSYAQQLVQVEAATLELIEKEQRGTQAFFDFSQE